MAIGNPITLTSNVASKTVTVIATASQTLFTVTGGYRINELAVFRNGVRLANGRDYTARDGLTVTLLSAASQSDVLEFQVFDTFRVAEAIKPNVSDQTIRGNLTVDGTFNATTLEGLTNFNLTSGITTFNDVRVGGALTVAGALTFEDVTNIDSVGIITAQSHVSIADSILHTGDTDTSIRFPSAGTFTVETNGSERLRVDSGGKILAGGQSTRGTAGLNTPLLQVEGNDSVNNSAITIVSNQNASSGPALALSKSRGTSTGSNTVVQDDDELGTIRFAGADGTDAQSIGAQITVAVDGTPGSNDLPSRLVFATTADGASSPSERLRIDSSGQVLINGGNDARSNFHGGGTTYRFQVEGTDFANSAPAFISNSDTAGHGPHITLARSRGTSVGSNTIVQDGDAVGVINFQGNDGTHFENVARIRAEIDGTPGANDMPGRLTFFTVADGGVSPSERLRIDSDGRLLINTTGQKGAGGVNARVQIDGTDSDSAIRITRNGNDTNAGYLLFSKSRGTSVGSNTIVQESDSLGRIRFCAADGNDHEGVAAEIWADVDSSPGNNNTPARLAFRTTPSGSAASVERMVIKSSGLVGINSHKPEAQLTVKGDGNIAAKDFKYNYSTTHGIQVKGNESAIDIVGTDSGNHGSSLLLRTSLDGFGMFFDPTRDQLRFMYTVPSADNFSIHDGGNTSTNTEALIIGKTGITTATQLFEGSNRVATGGKAIAMALIFG